MAAALVAKPNVTSPVWQHFSFQPNEKGEPANLDKTICKICARKAPVKQVNTSNLRSHLASLPAIEAQLLPPAPSLGAASKGTAQAGATQQLGEGEVFAQVAKYSRESKRRKCLIGRC